MVKLYTAFTMEIDNPEKAAREIIDQLKPAENALKNTLGLVHFYHEYAETGAYQAIVDALPFEVVGCLSSYIGTGGQHGDVALSVTMITGDDFSYKVRTVDDVKTKSHERIADEVKQVCTGFLAEGRPKVVIPLMAVLPNFTADDLVETANALPEPISMFGTIAFNMENVSGPQYVYANGKLSPEMYVFAALYGDFEPRYRVTSSFVFDEGFGDTAEITEADGAVLKMVNDMTALEYLKKQGLVTPDNMVDGSGMWAIPAILTYPNGTQVVRAFLGVVEGTEHIYSTGAMKAGAKVKFAFLDGDKTVASAAKLFAEVSEAKENGIISYSCAGRAWSLGANYSAEAQKITECADEYQAKNGTPLNYCVAYSGGEICPVVNSDGKLVNILHNYTLISCAFC